MNASNPSFSIKGSNKPVFLLLNKASFSKYCLNLLAKSLLDPTYLLSESLWVKIYTPALLRLDKGFPTNDNSAGYVSSVIGKSNFTLGRFKSPSNSF